MMRKIVFLALTGMLFLSSCARQQVSEAPPKPGTDTSAASATPSGSHAVVLLKDGSKVPGTIVASSPTDMVVAGDDGKERTIPISEVKSVSYGEARPQPTRRQASTEPNPAKPQMPEQTGQTAQTPQTPAPPAPEVTMRTFELPAGSEISVRTDEEIDSATAKEGQTFSVGVTRDAKDAAGNVIIPRGSTGRVAITSASKGGRIRGASDLVLDLQSVNINGKQYAIDTAEISQKGKSGVGANKRTAEYAGGGAALGAIIGAIAGGGKAAAIGAGAGAGAGVLTQVLTKGGAIKVPVESVLTFKLDEPLRVTEAQ
jgi:hypothetical protein